MRHYKIIVEYKSGRIEVIYEGSDKDEAERFWALPLPKKAKQKLFY